MRALGCNTSGSGSSVYSSSRLSSRVIEIQFCDSAGSANSKMRAAGWRSRFGKFCTQAFIRSGDWATCGCCCGAACCRDGKTRPETVSAAVLAFPSANNALYRRQASSVPSSCTDCSRSVVLGAKTDPYRSVTRGV